MFKLKLRGTENRIHVDVKREAKFGSIKWRDRKIV